VNIYIFKPSYFMRFILKAALLSLLICTAFPSQLILEPLQGKFGNPKALVLLPGARIKAERYTDFLRRIQAELSFPLIGVILKFPADVPQPVGLRRKIRKILGKISSNGFGNISAENTWIAGHSLGGIAARRVGEDYAGLILLASYFDRLSRRQETQISAYEKPILILSGAMDGLTRAPYILRDYAYDTNGASSGDWSRTMLLLEGANHSFFAGDSLIDGDIEGVRDSQSARQAAAEAIASYLTLFEKKIPRLRREEAILKLSVLKKTSDQLARPYQVASAMDHSLCEDAQHEVLSENLEDGSFKVGSKVLRSIYQFARAKPSLSVNPENQVEVETIQFGSDYSNILDRANLPLAPSSIACKMKSAEAVSNLMWVPGSQRNGELCSQIQLKIQQDILGLLSEDQYQRYLHSKNVLGEAKEKKHSTGFGWLSNRSSLIQKGDEGFDPVSHSLYTDLNAPFGLEGMVYCKFLSPARLLEWYTIDALLSPQEEDQ